MTDSSEHQRILSDLQKCFAHYDKDDIKRALIRTHELFARITRELAEAEGYEYPAGAVGFVLYDRKKNQSETAFSGDDLYYRIKLQ